MPKKHQPSYTSIKPTAAAANPRATSSSASNPPPPQSVNDRIQQLRREQTPRATQQRRDEVTEIVSRRTVPPHLRRILDIAEVDAPKPKPGSRTRATPLRPGQRPPPGPAAPTSWLLSSRHAPPHLRNLKRKYGGTAQGRLSRLARLNQEEYKRLPPRRSLVHQCLRTLAIHWEVLAEYEQHYLPSLPIPLKEALLSYLSLYGHRACLDFKSFKILFQADKEADGASGSEDVRFLDVTGLLNESYTLKDLEKSLPRSGSGAAMTSSAADHSVSKPRRAPNPPSRIAESWEDEEEDVSFVLDISSSLTTPFFPNIKRLSLAHPGAAASWTDLLALSPHLNTLTHLSLAYWPRPSTTPNATTTSMVSRLATVALGGSHFYSDLDDDWHEAANILRRLSLNTYCLKWLDLEGCSWLKALTWDVSLPLPSTPAQNARRMDPTADEWALRPGTSPGPDWNASWRQITYVNLFQGWIPSETRSLQNMPAGVVPVQLMRWLRERKENRVEGDSEDEEGDVVKEYQDRESAYTAAEWVEREKVARSVGAAIQSLRRAGEGAWCRVDYGWG